MKTIILRPVIGPGDSGIEEWDGAAHDSDMPDPQNVPAFLGAKKSAADFRTLKATVPAIEFGAVQWASKRCLVQHENGKVGPITLESFLRLALLAKLREVVREEIARGKPVPPDIAAVLDEKRGL